jgi:hypothetical protein
MPIFVVTLQGVETAGAPPLTVLAFVAAADEAAAHATGLAEVEALGWTGVEAQRAGEVTDETALPDDFRRAMAAARQWGCGLIIYDEP